ncbi:alpha/beta hydrolase [Actinomadura kijaniata]|uniref:Dienelactone hydrolase n=1 Tax=Actinomadura namibiensis TaxID=182080 RepID=A0A7W3LXP0_ACTNM|nr:alpha/beta hydrolase [Actinomadura namibiensis]MBA8956213.1 dienelactone hydrolase [Actinomadura namibiensis]
MNHVDQPRKSPTHGGLAVIGMLALALPVLGLSACGGSAPATTPAAVATPTPTPRLPEPTGPHPVGTSSLHLKDTSRPDPWVPEAKARELMVSLWYPAVSPGRRRAPYMTAKESQLLLESAQITGVPQDALSRTRTRAFTDARPTRERRLPLVILSPGFSEPRSTLTSLAEELASRGYAVAAIDHTYESLATTFPDGRTTTCAVCGADKDEHFRSKLANSRAADVSFVLDELTRRRLAGKRVPPIAPSRIAMAGHSAGGAGAIPAMLKDKRVRAGIDMDGTTLTPIPGSGQPRPFMFLGTQDKHSPGGRDTTWERDWEHDWEHLTGWKRWLVVAGAEHASFTDTPLLLEQLGIHRNPRLAGARAVELTRSYVRAFFDLHLRNKTQPRLDAPSTHHPEVRRCSVKTKRCQ